MRMVSRLPKKMMKRMKGKRTGPMGLISMVSSVLTIIGALNWLLVGLTRKDAVRMLTGTRGNLWARMIYSLVGAAGVTQLVGYLMRRTLLAR